MPDQRSHRGALRDLLTLLERTTVRDSYGVPGSDFTYCCICGQESGAGLLRRPGWHAEDCPVPRLKQKYAQRGQAPKGRTPNDHA